MSAESQPVFEPRGAETWRDPFGMYKALRDRDPVHHVPDNGEGEDYWVLSRFGHVIDAAVDAGTFSSAQGLTFSYGEMEKVGDRGAHRDDGSRPSTPRCASWRSSSSRRNRSVEGPRSA